MPTNNVIPTLREVMIALKGRKVMVDLDKSFPYYEEAYAVLKETGTLQQAIFKAIELIFAVDTSSVLADNRFIRDHGPKIWINALWPSLNAGHDDNRAVEEGDIKGSWDWLIAHGAGIIQTDRPRELVRYLGSR